MAEPARKVPGAAFSQRSETGRGASSAFSIMLLE
jgi:hypothetical protein